MHNELHAHNCSNIYTYSTFPPITHHSKINVYIDSFPTVYVITQFTNVHNVASV